MLDNETHSISYFHNLWNVAQFHRHWIYDTEPSIDINEHETNNNHNCNRNNTLCYRLLESILIPKNMRFLANRKTNSLQVILVSVTMVRMRI